MLKSGFNARRRRISKCTLQGSTKRCILFTNNRVLTTYIESSRQDGRMIAWSCTVFLSQTIVFCGLHSPPRTNPTIKWVSTPTLHDWFHMKYNIGADALMWITHTQDNDTRWTVLHILTKIKQILKILIYFFGIIGQNSIMKFEVPNHGLPGRYQHFGEMYHPDLHSAVPLKC